MSRIVHVDGKSGSGKSTVSYFLEGLGFTNLRFDDYVRNVLTGPVDVGVGKYFQLLMNPITKPEFWDRFWEERGEIVYNPESAREILQENRDSILDGTYQPIPEELFHISYVLCDAYIRDRDRALSEGKNVVLDNLMNRHVRNAMLKVDPEIERYLVRLSVDDEVAIDRKMDQLGWSHEKAKKIIADRHYDLELPDDIDYEVFLYKNNTPEDLEIIKKGLRSQFSD